LHFLFFCVYVLWKQQQVQNFGHPFLLVIREGETLAEVKLRIQKKLQVPDEEFSKVNITNVIELCAPAFRHFVSVSRIKWTINFSKFCLVDFWNTFLTSQYNFELVKFYVRIVIFLWYWSMLLSGILKHYCALAK